MSEPTRLDGDLHVRGNLRVDGKGGLPEVTEADNGKVLGVDNGEWAPVAGGGGGGDVLLVTASLNQDDEYELDKTYAEIAAAKWATVVHNDVDDSGVWVGYVCRYVSSGGMYGVLVQGWTSSSDWNTPFIFASDSPDGVLVEYSD